MCYLSTTFPNAPAHPPPLYFLTHPLHLGPLLHLGSFITFKASKCLNFVPSCAKFVSMFASFVTFPVFPSFYSCHLYSFVTCHFVLYLATVIVIHFSGALKHAKRVRSGAPWVRKFGKVSIRENLVIT